MSVVGVVDVVTDAIAVLPSPLDDPIVLIPVIVALGILLAGAFSLYRYLTRPPGRRFAEALSDVDSVAVLMHPNPDPDAMACALATRDIAESQNTDATMYYPGQIRHHENRAFEAVLDVEFNRIERASEIEEESVVLVDHNKPRDFPNAETIGPIAVVDHHPGNGTGSKFTDVRTDYGACSSIFAEYIQELDWTLVDPQTDTGSLEDGETVLSSDTATGLLYGIQADTNHLTNGCAPADFQATQFLYRAIDEGKLTRIANPDMDAESMDIKARAIAERDVRPPFAVSDVGTISNPDAIPQAANELQRLEGINAVVVFGDKDGIIRMSGRSSDDRVHMGKTLDAATEDMPMANAGGHARMGGGTASIEHMEGLGPGEGVTREELKERLFDAMNGER